MSAATPDAPAPESAPGHAPAAAQVWWEVRDFDPGLPGSGALVFHDDTGPVLWADLTPEFTTGLRQALEVVAAAHDPQPSPDPVARDRRPGAPGGHDQHEPASPAAAMRPSATRPPWPRRIWMTVAGLVAACLAAQVIAGAVRISL